MHPGGRQEQPGGQGWMRSAEGGGHTGWTRWEENQGSALSHRETAVGGHWGLGAGIWQGGLGTERPTALQRTRLRQGMFAQRRHGSLPGAGNKVPSNSVPWGETRTSLRKRRERWDARARPAGGQDPDPAPALRGAEVGVACVGSQGLPQHALAVPRGSRALGTLRHSPSRGREGSSDRNTS